MGKETIMHTYHQPLQYLQSQINIQQSRHFCWMGFLQQFHLVIKYKKGIHNKFANMLSRAVINASTILKHTSLEHEIFVKQHDKDDDFKDVYEYLIKGNHTKEVNYHVHTIYCIILKNFVYPEMKVLM